MARPGVSLELRGVQDALAALRELPQATEKPTVRKALVAAAVPMAEDAAARAPRDEGDLKEAMIATTRITSNQAADTRKPGRDEVRAFVGPNYSRSAKGKGYAPHAHLVEFGTGPRYQKSTGKFVGQMPAKPFMRPAFDTGASGFIDRFSVALLAMIDKAKARLARKAAKGRK